MGTHQQFCLRWNNHQSNFLSVFDDLLKHETLVDVTLACEGLSLKAHKVVLSACSPYFQHLFLDNPCKHPIVILKDIKFMDMKTLIDFMYKGEVNVSHDQLSTLLRVADTLKVKGLAEVTENMALQGTETAPPQTGGSAPQAAQAPQQQQHTRPDPSINSVSPPPKRRKKSRKTSGGSNGHSDDVDSGGGNNTFGQASAEMRSEVVPKNESSEQNYDNAGLLKSCAVVESASRSGGLSRSTASASQQASISQESSSHTHSYTNKNSLEVPQLYESSSGDMEADVSYRSTGLQHLSGRQDESTASPNTQAHLPSTSSSSHADQSEYFATTADATTPSTSRTSNSQEIGYNLEKSCKLLTKLEKILTFSTHADIIQINNEDNDLVSCFGTVISTDSKPPSPIIEITQGNHPHLRYGWSNETIEVVDGTGIYVPKETLQLLQLRSKTPTSFARGLMSNVYTMNALLTCSLMGGKAKGLLGKPEEQRQPLYAPGVKAIVDAVLDHSMLNGWNTSAVELHKAMGSRLCELRAANRHAIKLGYQTPMD